MSSFLTDSGRGRRDSRRKAPASTRARRRAGSCWPCNRGRTTSSQLTLSERWISNGVYSNEFIECQTNCPVATVIHPTIYDNHQPGATYLDFGASYKLSEKLTAYFKVDNLLNRDPVPSPQTNVTYGVNPVLYDVLGRQYRGGLRYNF
jgi:iron complex outermembrane receptor protein